MNKYTRNIKKHFLKLSLISLVFLMSSCSEKKIEKGTEKELVWATELGFKKVMKKLKDNTQLMTRKLGELQWDEAVALCKTIKRDFGSLDLDSPKLPEDFPEFKDDFNKYLEKLLIVCQNKESEEVASKLQFFKKACHYCHLRYRERLSELSKDFDFGVALERVYQKNPLEIK